MTVHDLCVHLPAIIKLPKHSELFGCYLRKTRRLKNKYEQSFFGDEESPSRSQELVVRKICFSCRPLLPANPTAFCHIKQAGCRVYCKHFDPSPSHSLFSELWKQFRREKLFPNKEFDNSWDYIPLRDLQDGGQTATASGRYSLTCKCTLLPAAAVSCLALLAQVIPKSIGALTHIMSRMIEIEGELSLSFSIEVTERFLRETVQQHKNTW